MTRQTGSVARDDRGVTLVEMLVAIVVLAVLVAIVVIGVARFRSDSVTAACKADLRIVRAAAEAYDVQHGRYPSSLADLTNAGYVKEPRAGVTYRFDAGSKTVTQEACDL